MNPGSKTADTPNIVLVVICSLWRMTVSTLRFRNVFKDCVSSLRSLPRANQRLARDPDRSYVVPAWCQMIPVRFQKVCQSTLSCTWLLSPTFCMILLFIAALLGSTILIYPSLGGSPNLSRIPWNRRRSSDKDLGLPNGMWGFQ